MSDVPCPFCSRAGVLFENDLAYVREDAFPVSEGHMLIISKRHAADWFSLFEEEQEAMISLLQQVKEYLDRRYHPDGYNIGLNCGAAAGQTVFHVHMHVIPRYRGDTPHPEGGVRGVIPAKQWYSRH